ncbi:MAG: dihydropteroate synthase-like protein, partial [Metallosphaera sp.]
IFLTMEKGKTKWSSWELRRATKMMTVAHEQGKVPKGLGIDLLIVKEKKRVEVPPISGQRIKAEKIEPKMDSGYFRIFLENRKIVASFSGRTNVLVEGEDGLSVGRTILREIGQISPDHALYLGYELAKAEIASSLDKSYIQDEPLVRRIGCEDSSSKDYDS